MIVAPDAKLICPRMMAPGFDKWSADARCVGKGCMAWRWAPLEYVLIETCDRDRKMPPDGPGWALSEDRTRWERWEARPVKGYCGLAGRPLEAEQ